MNDKYINFKELVLKYKELTDNLDNFINVGVSHINEIADVEELKDYISSDYDVICQHIDELFELRDDLEKLLEEID